MEPVLTIPEMLDHPQVQARNMVVHVPKPDGSVQQQIASPFKFSEGEAKYNWVGTAVGEHTDDVLQEAGYTQDKVGDLRRLGIFG